MSTYKHCNKKENKDALIGGRAWSTVIDNEQKKCLKG